MERLTIGRPDKSREQAINDFFRLVLENTFISNGLEAMPELLEEEIEEKRQCLQQDFESDGKRYLFLIAEIDGVIVGTIEYGPANKLIGQCTQHALDQIKEVGTVFVHPGYQGRGIGKCMSLAILKRMQADGLEEFCFDSGYPIAQEIWTHIYGVPEYRKRDFWGEGADHMIWHLKISDWIDCFEAQFSSRTNV